MGRANFGEIYNQAKKVNGTDSCKISILSDKYDPLKSYKGLIVYSINGQYNWTSQGGITNSRRGRSFYTVIVEEQNQQNGRGHKMEDKDLISHVLGNQTNNGSICCGRFSEEQENKKKRKIK
eukprot:TRINITY_DN2494_c1_g1_i3.p2 TRINITY_DN2494_c1_g1~~TRINITY_DN2494_c1_g1_i3.p2  ORF type:complete len:122 (-),score=8.89 TRINITY_DN2494_c1_g1_i3:53-418(-)